MPAIHLSRTDLNAGVRKALATFKKADASHGGMISPDEVKKFKGPGAAQLKAVFAYAQNIETRGNATKNTWVSLSTMERAIKNLQSGLNTLANTKGNKDGVVDGNEIKLASKAGAALARFTQAAVK